MHLNDSGTKLELIALNYIHVRLPGLIWMKWDSGTQWGGVGVLLLVFISVLILHQNFIKMLLIMPTQVRNLRSFIPIEAQWDLVFLGRGSHLLHPRGIFKMSHFGQQYPNFFLFAPFWWERSWNPSTSITYVDPLELYEYYQHPDRWSETPAQQVRGSDSAVSSILVLSRVRKPYKPISSGNLEPCCQDADCPVAWVHPTPAQRTFYMTLILQRRFYSPESLRRND